MTLELRKAQFLFHLNSIPKAESIGSCYFQPPGVKAEQTEAERRNNENFTAVSTELLRRTNLHFHTEMVIGIFY